ncbi:MAG: FHA domain-containing protein, partial [Gammaproteobacteria bacterium]|nr:FHA domain-containing protein [Gammaproteobacteria bacterium]
RSKDCDLVINEGHPSRRHAQISLTDDGVTIVDLGSANGTFVNLERVDEKRLLKDGDIVAFDICEFRFVWEKADQPEDSSDQTVIRSPDDLQQTIVRSAVKLRVEQSPHVEEKSPRIEEKTPRTDTAKPGSWADPNSDVTGDTVIYSREQLAQIAREHEHKPLDANSTQPYLKVGNGLSEGSIIRLTAPTSSGEWTIGSDDSRDITFTDDGVSAFHAKIVQQGGQWKLVDQLSKNGSFINEKKILTGFLKSGDRVRIGKVECVMVLPADTRAKGQGAASLRKGVISFVVILAALTAAYMLLG